MARFAERLIEATPIDVVAEFYPAFTAHDKGAALAVLDGLPALVLAGDKDLLTPSAHSEEIAERLPGAELVVVPDAGHLVLLERPQTVNAALAALVAKAADARAGARTAAAAGPDGRGRRVAFAIMGNPHDPYRAAAGTARGRPRRPDHRPHRRTHARAGAAARRAAAPRRPGAAQRRTGRRQDDADPRASARAWAYAAP